MVGAIWLISRAEIRRHRWSMVVLGFTTALVISVVLALAAGARRTDSVLDRFVDVTRARDIEVFVVSSEMALHPELSEGFVRDVRGLDGVEQVGYGRGFVVGADTEVDFVVASSPDGTEFTEIDQFLVLEGRMPSPGAAAEVLLNESAASALNLKAGSELAVPTFSPEDITVILSGGAFPGFNGPTLDLAVVGIGRGSDELQGQASDSGPIAVASPAFFDLHRAEMGSSILFLGLRTDGTVTDDELLGLLASSDLSEAQAAGVSNVQDTWFGEVSEAHRVVTSVLWLLVVVTTIAGLLAIAQGVIRQIALSSGIGEPVRALGLTRGSRALARGVPASVGVVGGVLAAVPIAFAASWFFPLSLARRAEPNPGHSFDPWILGVGGAVAVAAVLLLTMVAAQRAQRAAASRGGVETMSSALSRWGGLAASIGVRMVLDRRVGGGPAPARAAVSGVVVAAAGLVGVAAFATSVTDTVDRPERYGWTWTSRPDSYADDPSAALASAAEEPGIDAAASLRCSTVDFDSVNRQACALDPVRGSMTLSVISGRLPAGPSEVALGRGVLDDLDLRIGDTVRARDAQGVDQELKVVGQSLTPMLDIRSPGEGAILTPGGLEALLPVANADPGDTQAVFRYAAHVDAAELEAKLASRYSYDFSFYSRPEPPGQLTLLARARGLLVGLAVFLGAIGALGLGHYLAVSVRQRRRDFAVLQALGFRRREIRHVVSWQAVATSLIGAALGVPLGVVLGHTAWRLSVRALGMADQASTPWVFGAVVLGGALAGAACIAIGPGWLAARRPPADTLHIE